MSQVLDTETAEKEFGRFLEAMDLDVDPKGMDDEDKRTFEESKRRVVRALEQGQLVIDDKGQPVFTPSAGGNPITFYEPTGAALMAADQKRSGHNMAKMFATMGDMTRTNAALFAKMVARDVKVCLAVALLFLGG